MTAAEPIWSLYYGGRRIVRGASSLQSELAADPEAMKWQTAIRLLGPGRVEVVERTIFPGYITAEQTTPQAVRRWHRSLRTEYAKDARRKVQP